MVRMIVCDGCTNKYTDPPPLGEFIVKVTGKAKDDYKCDLCNADIKTDDYCAAVSISTMRKPYYSWEEDFINILTREKD